MCNYKMNIEIRQDSIFFVFSFFDCAYYTSRFVQSLSHYNEPAIHCTVLVCYLSNVLNVLFLFVVVNALFLRIGN